MSNKRDKHNKVKEKISRIEEEKEHVAWILAWIREHDLPHIVYES